MLHITHFRRPITQATTQSLELVRCVWTSCLYSGLSTCPGWQICIIIQVYQPKLGHFNILGFFLCLCLPHFKLADWLGEFHIYTPTTLDRDIRSNAEISVETVRPCMIRFRLDFGCDAWDLASD